MMVDTQRFIFGWSIILLWIFVATQVFAADLATPRRQNLTIVPLPRLSNPTIAPSAPQSAVSAPISRALEPCLAPDVKPVSGQALQPDQTCPTGLRWKYQK